ncbi:hypothetical protein MiSe_92700 [Microseira wollei NIES-4236]|uniref:Transposase n=1 Tax=Microseira wollei NIES-4236 TaxID=2530354 RepID=A0AAV3XUN2_9CYAN|nr:hypothetical protein MiSe_92700 [Microseira wollei NIES-4236]
MVVPLVKNYLYAEVFSTLSMTRILSLKGIYSFIKDHKDESLIFIFPDQSYHIEDYYAFT